MRAGRLRERVDILAPSHTTDAAGAIDDVGHAIATGIAASISPTAGGEGDARGTVEATQTYRVVMRWRPDLDPKFREPKHRLRFRHRGVELILEISRVDNVNFRDRKITLTCHALASRPELET